MNIDSLFLENVDNLYKVGYPLVIIKDKEIARELKRFLYIRRNVDVVFGKILSQFGFSNDDIIVLKNISYNTYMNVVSFEYSVNLVNNSSNKISLDYSNYRNELVISDGNRTVVCECSVTSFKDIRVRIKKILDKVDDEKLYSRTYDYSSSNYRFVIGSRKFNLYLKKNNDNDYERLMVVDNDKKIEEYFKNIDCSISLDKLYKDIAVYLGNIDSYDEIKLEMSNVFEDKKCISDLLVLKNGICETFMMTSGIRTVCLNGENNWEHDYDNGLCCVSTVCNDGKITYSISSDVRERFYIQNLYGLDVALADVDDTKRLVREMFPKNKR